MKCPVCNNEINGFVCSECGFDESMNYEKFPTVAVFNNSIESISVKIDNYRSPWEADGISDLYRLELVLTNAVNGVGKAQRDFAKICFEENELDRFNYWKEQAEKNGYAVDCLTPARIKSGDVRFVGFKKTNPYEAKDKICTGYYNTVRVRSDGTCVSTTIMDKRVSYGQDQVSGWTDIVDVAVGEYHTVGLKNDGTVVSTKVESEMDFGQAFVEGWHDIVSIAVGTYFTVGLRRDGSVNFCGKYISNNEIQKWYNLVSVSVSSDHIMGLKKDGTVVACGNNRSRKCEVSEWKDIIAVSAGYHNSIGLKSDGTVVSTTSFWSYNTNKIKSWENIKTVSAGLFHLVGLKEDGTVVYCGSNNYNKCDISDWTDIVSISAEMLHTVGLKSNGEIVAVGDNSYGQCNVNELMSK